MTVGKKILRITAKTFLWLIGIFIFLFALVWIVLKVPSVQNYLVTKATNYVHKKTQTRVELGYIDIGFPKSILLQRVFLEDKSKDTLLYVRELAVDINMLALLNHTVSVQKLSLEQSYLRLIRSERDSSFNFQFLIDAFAKADTTKEVEKDTSASTPWDIKANNLSLSSFHFKMDDSISGLKVAAQIGELDASLNKLDLQNSSVDIGKVKLENVHGTVALTKASSSDTDSTSSGGWNSVAVSEVSIEKSSFNFIDSTSQLSINTIIEELELERSSLDINKQSIKSEGLTLNKSNASIKLLKNKSTGSSQINDDTSTSDNGWSIEVNSLNMEKNFFSMDFTNEKEIRSGIDWNHLHLSSINAEIKDIQYSLSNINATIKSLSAQDRSGFGIRSLEAKAHMDDQHASLSNLILNTNHSYIGQNIKVEYSSLENIMSSLYVDCSMRGNRFAMRELLFLVPDLDTVEIINKNKNEIVQFDLVAKGTLQEMFVRQLSLKTRSSNIVAQGKVKYLTEPDKLFLDISANRIESGSKDILALLPDSTIPSSIHIPDTILLKGNYKGTLSDFKTQAIISSSSGGGNVDATISDLQKEIPSYELLVNSENIHLRKILGQPNLGELKGKVEASGKGLKKETASAKAKVEINSIKISNYNYKDIHLKGSIDKGLVKAVGNIDDTNLLLSFDSHFNLDTTKEEYDLKLNLRGADFYALGLSRDRINLTATTDIHLIGDPTKNINGHIATKNILVIKNGRKYKTDSLVLVSINEPGKTKMKLNSSMIGASFEGNLDILSVGPAISNHLNRYFQFSETAFKATRPQNFNFEIQLNDSPLLREVILPALTEYNPLHIKGSFNSEEAKLAINAEIPSATYDNLSVDNFTFAIDSDPSSLHYSANWNYLKTAGITIQQTTLSGKIANDSAMVNLKIQNEQDEDKLVLHSFIRRASAKHYRFSILPDGLELEGKKWTVAEGNYIEFAPKYLFAEKVILSKGNQLLNLQSSNAGNDIALKFKSFYLSSFSQIVEEDKPFLRGIMDGEILLKDFLKTPAFTSELKITDLRFKESRVGNLQISGDNLTSQRYTAKIILSDSTNHATISGYYLTNQASNALNFNVDIESIELASIEGFSGGQIYSSDGIIKGKIAISGAVKDPKFNGDIKFVNASTKVAYINQRVFINKEKISITQDKVTFNSFTVLDSLNNEAIINGYVGIKSFSDINFNLGIVTKKFMVLNTTAVNNKLYYGKVILDSRISIKGNPDLPIINANVDIVRGSHFTFAIPDSKISVDRGSGIVVFTADSSSLDPIMLRQQEEEAAKKITGLDITANINIDRKSTLKILVDPISGDSLSVRGDADLNFRMDASGQTSLNGRYVVADGSYKASLENLLVRRFKITSGSTILWTGDPLEALIDISATYSTRTSPEGLLATAAIIDSSALRKPLPFTVVMMMKGELLKPVISFKLDMPDNSKGALGGEVYSKITEINSNESEVNKQVFALLVLNRFIAPNDGGSDASSSAFARRSVSRMMSNELNKLSSKYVNGLQIDVDIQSYNDINNGQQQGNTQVELGVTKSLLDERLSVQVGTNVAIEGQNANASSNAKNFTGDVIVEYKLTKNGRYRVKAFRTNQYDGISNGTIVQTGVGLGYTRNFTHVGELFTSNRKRKKK